MSAPNESTVFHASSTGQLMTSADWLDAHFLAMQPEYEEMLRWVGIQPNWHVLDAGCGGGSFLPLMTELVGAGGKVSAMDLAPENVQMVEALIHRGILIAPVETRVGSVLNIPFPDQTFDAVWCANVMQYLSDEELRMALKELRRVVRSGGLVAIKDYDVTAQQFQPAPPTLALHWHTAGARKGNVNELGLLRTIQLAQWLRAAGLIDIRQKPTLMVRFQPLRPVEKSFLGDGLKWFYLQAKTTELPTEELQVWKTLADVDSPDNILNHPDFQYRAIQTVFVGRAP